jgi:hypothetical protein
MPTGEDSAHKALEVLSDQQRRVPFSDDESAVLSVEDHAGSGGIITHVLPLRWSLAFALTKKQWRDLKERHKTLHPDWEQCICPKRCKTNTLDENWRYDHETHTKHFAGSAFICAGCHWFKSLTWRMETWRKQDGLLPALSKPPHIIDCLGWTQERVDALREEDLKQHRSESVKLAQLEQEIKAGNAAVAPSPLARLPAEELAVIARPGQFVVVPWKVDLSALAVYGYSADEIAVFEERMYQLAAKRMAVTVEA